MPDPAPRIALVGPVSGQRAAWGQLLLAAATEMCGTVRADVFDDTGDAAHARRCAERIVRGARHAAVVGHFNSSGARAALPVYHRVTLPCLLPLATAPGLTSNGHGAGALALRWCPDDDAQAFALAVALTSRGHAQAGVIHDGTDYGMRLARCLRARGLTPVDAEAVARSRRPPSAVVVAGLHYQSAALACQLRNTAGYNGQLAFTDDCAVPEFCHLGGPAVQGALLAVLPRGAGAYVREAVAAVAGVLASEPTLRGRTLVRAIRHRSPTAFDDDGNAVGRSWHVVQLDGVGSLPAEVT